MRKNTGLNPRWARAAQFFKAQLRPLHAGDFMCWLNTRWREFCKEQGYRDAAAFLRDKGEAGHKAFDAWLHDDANVTEAWRSLP
jgi:hypothetical protein